MDAPKICTAKPCILDALVIQLPSSSLLVFGIVAMPFVGLSLILRRESGPVTRLLGLILFLVAIAAWGYLVYYSTH